MGQTTESEERAELYAQLQNEAASLDTIHEMLGSGKWTMDFDESGTMVRVNWSDEFRRMLGYHDQEDFPNVLESWSNLLHPNDKERVLNEFNETIADYTGKKAYDVEYQLLTKDRGYRWYRAVGKPTRRPDGSPITYVGVFLDITEQKDMFSKLAQQRESLNAALQENITLAETFFREHLPQVTFARPEGTYLLWLDFSAFGLTGEQIREKLVNEAGAALNPGRDYGRAYDSFLRMNIAVPKWYLEEGLKKIARAFSA